MPYSTTIGVDLAKNVMQVSVVSDRGKELVNRSLTRMKFAEFLGKQKPSLVAFESCASAHYWAWAAVRLEHEVRIIPAKTVAPFRQRHKTDSNDALAVAEAARRPNVKGAPMKSVEQQGLQAIQRARELLIGECIALSNHLRGILLEFGVTVPQGLASLLGALPGKSCRRKTRTGIDTCSSQTCTALRSKSLPTLRGYGERIHTGPGDSVSNKRPNIQTRLLSD